AADGSLYPTPLGYARVPLPQVPQVPQYGTVPYAPARRNPLLGAQFMKPINVPITQTSLKCQKCNCCALLAGFSISGGYPPIGPIGPNGKIGPLGPIFPRPGSRHLFLLTGQEPRASPDPDKIRTNGEIFYFMTTSEYCECICNG
ncbi:hypothetical protein TELCIR_13257, partial [Teladorsagia circumcincta]